MIQPSATPSSPPQQRPLHHPQGRFDEAALRLDEGQLQPLTSILNPGPQCLYGPPLLQSDRHGLESAIGYPVTRNDAIFSFQLFNRRCDDASTVLTSNGLRATLFRRSRPPVPSEVVQLFRAKLSTRSGPSRPGLSGDREGVLDMDGSGVVGGGGDLLG